MAEPVLPTGKGLERIGAEVGSIPLDFPARGPWLIGAAVSFLLLLNFIFSVGVLFTAGIGSWGVNSPVFWGIAIMNYVWWVGIGNAGTLISAALLLLQRVWRNALNRFAEAMTLFAMVCAGIYPIIHLGRPWLFYWMFPYPNVMDVWPQFRSPLSWDVFAILIYFIVSLIFWYTGLIPDLAIVRDRARGRFARAFYGVLALGWRGSAWHWMRWRQAYVFTAAVAVPLVVSVHSEVGMLFAASQIPGWHSTLFPPFFVVGAAYSGFGVVTMLAVGIRRAFRLQDLITPVHLDVLGKCMLAASLLMAYGYGWELFDSAWSGDPYEMQMVMDRLTGAYAWSFWATIGMNVAIPQLLWLKAARRSPLWLFLMGLDVTIGMWWERYMLVVTSLYKEFLPSSWGYYIATYWDWAVFAGTVGLFLFPFFLFIRILPVVSATEIKEAVADARRSGP